MLSCIWTPSNKLEELLHLVGCFIWNVWWCMDLQTLNARSTIWWWGVSCISACQTGSYGKVPNIRWLVTVFWGLTVSEPMIVCKTTDFHTPHTWDTCCNPGGLAVLYPQRLRTKLHLRKKKMLFPKFWQVLPFKWWPSSIATIYVVKIFLTFHWIAWFATMFTATYRRFHLEAGNFYCLAFVHDAGLGQSRYEFLCYRRSPMTEASNHPNETDLK
jgi:hypothetical protein